jgi:putative ABC transport system permease protein
VTAPGSSPAAARADSPTAAPRARPMTASHRPVRLSPSDLLRLGLIGIRTRRVRAALGISIGIATMIVVTGIPASSQRALNAELTALGTDRLQAIADANAAGGGKLVAFPAESVAMVDRLGPVSAVAAVANTHTVVRTGSAGSTNPA